MQIYMQVNQYINISMHANKWMLTSDCRSCKLTDDFTFKTGYPTAFPMSQIFSNSVSRFIVNYIFVLFLRSCFFFLDCIQSKWDYCFAFSPVSNSWKKEEILYFLEIFWRKEWICHVVRCFFFFFFFSVYQMLISDYKSRCHWDISSTKMVFREIKVESPWHSSYQQGNRWWWARGDVRLKLVSETIQRTYI